MQKLKKCEQTKIAKEAKKQTKQNAKRLKTF